MICPACSEFVCDKWIDPDCDWHRGWFWHLLKCGVMGPFKGEPADDMECICGGSFEFLSYDNATAHLESHGDWETIKTAQMLKEM